MEADTGLNFFGGALIAIASLAKGKGPTLRSIHHCLKPGGVVILNLPAIAGSYRGMTGRSIVGRQHLSDRKS